MSAAFHIAVAWIFFFIGVLGMGFSDKPLTVIAVFLAAIFYLLQAIYARMKP